jgi:putative endonuclease
MYYVYAIKSRDHVWIYVGMSANLEQRLDEHNRGKNKSTRHYLPFILVYSETHSDRFTARAREKYLKSGSGKRWLKKQISGNNLKGQ